MERIADLLTKAHLILVARDVQLALQYQIFANPLEIRSLPISRERKKERERARGGERNREKSESE